MHDMIAIDLDLIKSFGFDVYIPENLKDSMRPLTYCYYADAFENIGYVQCDPVWGVYSIATKNKQGCSQSAEKCYKSELSREILKKGFLTNPLKMQGIIVKYTNLKEFLEAQTIIKLQKYQGK